MKDFKLMSQGLLDLIFPSFCVNCGEYGQLLCKGCFEQIKTAEQRCIICSKPSVNGITHSACLEKYFKENKVSAPVRTIAVCEYNDNTVFRIITAFKYNFIKDLDVTCAKIMIKRLHQLKITFNSRAIICAVPMHPNKEKLRGFNQSELICSELSKHLGLAHFPLLVKTKRTKAQMTLNGEERKKNLQGSFSAHPCLGKHVLLIDDVLTTGSTLFECSKQLYLAGAASVQCLVFARD